MDIWIYGDKFLSKQLLIRVVWEWRLNKYEVMMVCLSFFNAIYVNTVLTPAKALEEG